MRFVDSLGEITLPTASDHREYPVVVTDPEAYRAMVRGGSLGFADAFVRGQWHTPDLPGLLSVLAAPTLAVPGGGPWRVASALVHRLTQRRRRNHREGSRRNIEFHYDLSNEFFANFLDPTMAYSCGLFAGHEISLEEASQAKFARIASQLQLSSADHLLEIGCGWGGFAQFAAANYGCRVTGVTISQEQLAYAQQRIAAAGLSHLVDIKYCDYRDLSGKYDKIASIEMIEAVGHQYLSTFLEKCDASLIPGGKFLLQAITIPDQRYDEYRRRIDFIQKYIFPGGCLVSHRRLRDLLDKHTSLELTNRADFPTDYRLTLLTWRDRFLQSQSEIQALGFSERDLRIWDYYFSYCAAGFGQQLIGVSQLLYEKPSKAR